MSGPADAGASSDSDIVLLDRPTLEKVRTLGGGALLARLIDLFLENAPERLARARAADARGDFETLERATHSLKSTAGNLGARRLQTLAERAENAAALRDAAPMAPLLERLEAVYEETRQVLIQERRGLDT